MIVMMGWILGISSVYYQADAILHPEPMTPAYLAECQAFKLAASTKSWSPVFKKTDVESFLPYPLVDLRPKVSDREIHLAEIISCFYGPLPFILIPRPKTSLDTSTHALQSSCGNNAYNSTLISTVKSVM